MDSTSLESGSAESTGQSLCMIAYVSASMRPMGSHELQTILRTARNNNEGRGITGLLVHHHEGFVQVLEGPRPAVEDLLVRIRRDPRHRGVIVFHNADATTRLFPQWSMAYHEVAGSDRLEGFNSLLIDPTALDEYAAHPARAYRMLAHYSRMGSPLRPQVSETLPGPDMTHRSGQRARLAGVSAPLMLDETRDS